MKHPYSVRLAAVQHYLLGKATLAETARHFHVGESPLIRWVRAFRNQGEAGLTHRLTRHYSPEFKLRVVRYVLDNRCSSADASAHFAIPNETVIQNWLRKYRSGGSVALVTSTNHLPMEVFGMGTGEYLLRKSQKQTFYNEKYGSDGWWYWDAYSSPSAEAMPPFRGS